MGISKELQDYYEAQIELFASKGWRDFVEHASEIRESIQNIKNIKDSDDLRFKQGELSNIDWILGWEQMCRDAFEELKNETN